jgi:hypothetical protein
MEEQQEAIEGRVRWSRPYQFGRLLKYL